VALRQNLTLLFPGFLSLSKKTKAMKANRFQKYLDKVREGLELRVGEITIDYAIAPQKVSDLPKVTQSSHAYDFFRSHWESDICETERFKVLFLNNQNRIIAWYNLGIGTSTACQVDIKKLVSIATNIISCKSLIFAHCHPSCTTQPSASDIELVKNLKSVMNLLDMSVLDNLILTPDGEYLSFADQGMMP
jgi:DNA repair protein RadC